MSKKRFVLIRFAVAILLVVFLTTACATSTLKVPKQGDSAQLKGYARVGITLGNLNKFKWKDSGLEVAKGDRILVLISPEKDNFYQKTLWTTSGITVRAGNEFNEWIKGERGYLTATGYGMLQFGGAVHVFKERPPKLIIDAFVLDPKSEALLPAILLQLQEANPEDPYIQYHQQALDQLKFPDEPAAPK